MATANPGPVSRSAVSGIDIRVANDIAISVGVAARMADVIDWVRELLARHHKKNLPTDVADIQKALRECVRLRAACADASAQVLWGHCVLPSSSELLTVKAAAAELGITESRVRWLCEYKHLGDKHGGRQWWIDREDLEMFKATRGKGVA